MKLAELFNEGTYGIKGPPIGSKLPVSGDNSAVDMYVDLRGKRIDKDNPQGPTISDEKSEIEQKNIVNNLRGRQIIVPKGPDAGTWVVQAVSGWILTVQDVNDPDPEPAQKEINASTYYVDDDNNDGMVHLELERGRARKHRVSVVDLGRGAGVTVQ